VESILILVGVLSVMSVVALRQDLAEASNSGAMVEAARGLLAVHDQTRLLGPQFCVGIGKRNSPGLLDVEIQAAPAANGDVGPHRWSVGRSRGHWRAVGAWDKDAGLPIAMTAPETTWEASLSLWLLIKGFRPSPILTGQQVVMCDT
jgi:hypothetical protein